MKRYFDFLRELFLNAEPSIDLDQSKDIVDCSKHFISQHTFSQIFKKYRHDYGCERGTLILLAVLKGPTIKEGGHHGKD